MENEAVITGIGLVTPLGIGIQKSWFSLLNGYSAVAPDTEFDGIFSARVRGVDVAAETRLLSMGFLAAGEAVADSRLDINDVDPGRFGCTVSVSKPNLFLHRNVIDGYMPSMLGIQLQNILKINGPGRSISAACATGTNSIALAADWIKHGVCDVVLAGAAEASLHPLYIAGFDKLGVLTKTMPSPFDKNRQGFAIGEGAGIFIVERKDRALLRGAKIYAAIRGYAMGNDNGGAVAFNQSGEPIADVIKRALKKAGLESVDYINAHGTGTKLNDLVETRAIKQAFGKNAYKIPVSSTKAATGHLLGASGAVEAGFCLLSMKENAMPPTLNLNEPDSEMDLDYIPWKTRIANVESSASLSFGFGGQIGVLVFSRN